MATFKLKTQQLTAFFFTAVAFALVAWRGIATEADPDLWGHVRFGQDILKLGAIPSQDPYSYLTENGRWINHEWLSETLFGLLYNLAGPQGLVAFKCFCVVLIALLMWRSLRSNGFDSIRAAEILIVVEVMLLPAMTPLRPNIFTCVMLTLLLLVLEKCSRAVSDQFRMAMLLIVPVLFACWANVHGGFVLGLIVLSAWWIGSIIDTRNSATLQRKSKTTWVLLGVVPLSIVGTMLTPYGPDLLRFIVETTAVRRTDISEWQPLGITNTFGFYYLATLVVSALSLVFSRKTKRLSTLGAWFVLACAPQVAYRFLPLFAIGTIILAGQHIADSGYRLYENLKSKRLLLLPIFAAWALVVVISAVGVWSQLRDKALGQIVVSSYMPVGATSILKQRNIKGNALVQFNWGEYVIWHLGPEVKIAVDGRRETVYPNDIRALYLNFATGAGNWDAVLDMYPTDLVLMEPYVPAANLMLLKPGWVRVYSDDSAWLFVKTGSELEKALSDVKAAQQDAVSQRALYFP